MENAKQEQIQVVDIKDNQNDYNNDQDINNQNNALKHYDKLKVDKQKGKTVQPSSSEFNKVQQKQSPSPMHYFFPNYKDKSYSSLHKSKSKKVKNLHSLQLQSRKLENQLQKIIKKDQSKEYNDEQQADTDQNSPQKFVVDKTIDSSKFVQGGGNIEPMNISPEMKQKYKRDKIKQEMKIMFKAIKFVIYQFFSTSKIEDYTEEEMKIQLSYYSILHEDFKHQKYLQKYFIVFDLSRHLLLNFEVVAFYQSAYAQISALLLTQTIWIVYFNFYLRPFNNKIIFRLTVLLEILINIALISAFILFLYDVTHNANAIQRLNIGWVIIFSGFALQFLMIIYYLYKQILPKVKIVYTTAIAFTKVKNFIRPAHQIKSKNKDIQLIELQQQLQQPQLQEQSVFEKKESNYINFQIAQDQRDQRDNKIQTQNLTNTQKE